MAASPDDADGALCTIPTADDLDVAWRDATAAASERGELEAWYRRTVQTLKVVHAPDPHRLDTDRLVLLRATDDLWTDSPLCVRVTPFLEFLDTPLVGLTAESAASEPSGEALRLAWERRAMAQKKKCPNKTELACHNDRRCGNKCVRKDW